MDSFYGSQLFCRPLYPYITYPVGQKYLQYDYYQKWSSIGWTWTKKPTITKKRHAIAPGICSWLQFNGSITLEQHTGEPRLPPAHHPLNWKLATDREAPAPCKGLNRSTAGGPFGAAFPVAGIPWLWQLLCIPNRTWWHKYTSWIWAINGYDLGDILCLDGLGSLSVDRTRARLMADLCGVPVDFANPQFQEQKHQKKRIEK